MAQVVHFFVPQTVLAPAFYTWWVDIETGQISMASPLGQTLLGKQVGDEVTLKLPRGSRKLKITELTTLPEMARGNS